MASSQEIQDSDAIITIKAKNFIFCSVLAFHITKPIVVPRKPKKLLGKLIMKKYDLEYDYRSLAMHKKINRKISKFCLVDDVLAKSDTARSLSDLL